MNTEKIRELRERTGLGLKEAIARLEAAGGDVETAVNGRPSELENMSCRFAELQNENKQLRARVEELEYSSTTLEAKLAEAQKALRELSNSLEYQQYVIDDSPPDDQLDEYDGMMKPIWKAATAAIDAARREDDRARD